MRIVINVRGTRIRVIMADTETHVDEIDENGEVKSYILSYDSADEEVIIYGYSAHEVCVHGSVG